MARPQKRSVTLAGHRTSVTLEREFWQALKEMADQRHLSINQIVSEIDEMRMAATHEVDAGLSSAIRVFVLNEIRKESSS